MTARPNAHRGGAGRFSLPRTSIERLAGACMSKRDYADRRHRPGTDRHREVV